MMTQAVLEVQETRETGFVVVLVQDGQRRPVAILPNDQMVQEWNNTKQPPYPHHYEFVEVGVCRDDTAVHEAEI